MSCTQPTHMFFVSIGVAPLEVPAPPSRSQTYRGKGWLRVRWRRLVCKSHLSIEGHDVPLHLDGNLDELLAVRAFDAFGSSLLVLNVHDGVGFQTKEDGDVCAQEQAKVSFGG